MVSADWHVAPALRQNSAASSFLVLMTSMEIHPVKHQDDGRATLQLPDMVIKIHHKLYQECIFVVCSTCMSTEHTPLPYTGCLPFKTYSMCLCIGGHQRLALPLSPSSYVQRVLILSLVGGKWCGVDGRLVPSHQLRRCS